MAVAVILPFLGPEVAHAYGQVTSRSIEMSDSSAGATNVTYTLAYTTATTSNVGGVVVDFCSNSPIIGDTCTAPSGFNTNEATLVLANQSGITGLTVDTTYSTTSTLILDRTASSINSSTSVSIDLGTSAHGITNPSTANQTFYARVYTFSTTADAQAYSATGTNTGLVDAGGIALSTAATITITAKVQEEITFCVYTGANCAAGGTSVALGDTHGVLSSTGPFVDISTKYDVASNASSGVTIRMKGNTLQSGSSSIAAIGASAASSSAGTSQFGLCTWENSGSTLTPTSPYNNASCSTTSQTAGTGSTGGAGSAQFAFNTTNTTSTYGDTLASATAGASSTGTIAFIGNISTSQQAGIYTTTLTFIATGNY